MEKIYIEKIEDLDLLRFLNPKEEYRVFLERDLDFSDKKCYKNYEVCRNNFEPIEIKGSKVVFDGQLHLIRNIHIYQPNNDLIGIFNTSRGACVFVKNLKIENSSVIGRNYVGLIGGKFNGIISNCFFRAFVYGNSIVGGITGQSDNSLTINNSEFICNVGSEGSVGLIFGIGNELKVRKSSINGIAMTDGIFVDDYFETVIKANIEGFKIREPKNRGF